MGLLSKLKLGLLHPIARQVKEDRLTYLSHSRYDVIASGAAKGIGVDDYYGYIDKLYDRVVQNFEAYDLEVDGDRISLHQGLFEDTLRLAPDTKIALVHVDCDWYDPVKFCLETTAPHISPGGFVVIDDYNDYEGCRKASDEFLAHHPDFQMRHHKSHAVLQRKT